MAVARLAVRAIVMAAKSAIRKVIVVCTRTAARRLILKFLVSQAQDFLISQGVKAAKSHTKGSVKNAVQNRIKLEDLTPEQRAKLEKAMKEYMARCKRREKEAMKRMDHCFADSVTGIARIKIIGPAVVKASGYCGDPLPPHLVFDLIEATIRHGSIMVDNLWNKTAGRSGLTRFVSGIADGFGVNTFTMMQDSQLQPYIRALCGKQRQWVQQLQAGQPIRR